MKKIILFSFLSCFIVVNVFAHGCASGKHDEKIEIGFKNELKNIITVKVTV